MVPATVKPHNGRKPIPPGRGSGFQISRKVYRMSVLQQTEIVATRVLTVPKKNHFLNRLPLRAYEPPHNLFSTKKHGACLLFFLRKGAI